MDTQQTISQNKNIAVVGLSDKPERASYQVAEYLQKNGYRIIPINPTIDEVLGEKAYPSVSAVPETVDIDIVDIFRKPEAVISVIEDVIKSKRRPTIWLQEGVSSLDAEDFIKDNGFNFVSNLCMMKEHRKNN